jgi:hypothetical protein
VEDILEWPWRRFEVFYSAFMKRHVVETLERRKEGMIHALWANDGFNDNKGTRQNAIQEIEANFEEAKNAVLGLLPEEAEIDKDNPFFAQMEKGMAKLHESHGESEETVKARIDQEADFHRYIDQ